MEVKSHSPAKLEENFHVTMQSCGKRALKPFETTALDRAEGLKDQGLGVFS